MTKFHLTASGPRVCEAEKRACPIGGKHFTDRESAEVAFLREGAFTAVPSPHTRLATLPPLEYTGSVSFMAGYQGVKVPGAMLAPMLEAWREAHGLRALELEERLNEVRGSERHLTVVAPREQRKHREIRSPQEPISFTATGIGAVEQDGEEAWFIVCSSPQVQELRARYGLPPKDLHITIGFSSKDIHGVAKDVSTLRYI